MLNRVSSHQTISTTNKYNKFLLLLTLGGASAAACYWMFFRRKNNRNLQSKETNRRKGNHTEIESRNPIFVTENNSTRMEPKTNDNLEPRQNSQQTQLNSIKEKETIIEEETTKTNQIHIDDEEVKKEIVVEQLAEDIKKLDMGVGGNEQNCETKESGQVEMLGSAKMLTQPSSSKSAEKQRLVLASLLDLDIILEPQPEFNWAEAVEAEEKKELEAASAFKEKERHQEKLEKEKLTESENKKMNGMLQMQHQEGKSPKALYSGRNSSSSGRQQHPINGICTCSRCVETLNDLQSSRGYKNAESPHSTHSEGSADSGRATGPLTSCSPFAIDEFGQQSEILPIYEFEVPNTLVGLIIGIKGKTIRELCIRANVRMLIRPHHTPNKYETHQICSVEGRRDDINKCLHMIRLRFPPCRFPDLNLKPVLPPPPTTPITARGTPTAQTLPVGVPCEVYISAHVDAGHFFLQLPTHPSFSSLAILDQYMLSVYTQPGGAPEIPKPCKVGVLCAAPAYNGWFRAITLAYEPEQDEVLVRFVDYGGFARLPRADLRQIRTDFMTLPMQAIECYLANVQPIDGSSHWSEKANELFQHLCVSKIIQAALLGYCKHDGLPCVELYVLDENKKTVRVDQMLLERGLAKPADPTILVASSLSNSSSS